jgi:hypothetical protein
MNGCQCFPQCYLKFISNDSVRMYLGGGPLWGLVSPSMRTYRQVACSTFVSPWIPWQPAVWTFLRDTKFSSHIVDNNLSYSLSFEVPMRFRRPYCVARLILLGLGRQILLNVVSVFVSRFSCNSTCVLRVLPILPSLAIQPRCSGPWPSTTWTWRNSSLSLFMVDFRPGLLALR